MSYLIPQDYRKSIQDQNLQAVISSDPTIQAAAELAAQEECTSYLIQKYLVDQEFTNTNPYDPTVAYNAADRVFLDAPTYVQQVYALGAVTLQAGKVYVCSTAVANEVFTAGHWTVLGNQYSLFFAKYPFPQFNLATIYRRGTQVYWNGHIYTCLIGTQPYTQDVLLQFQNTTNIPPNNIFPDDQVQGPTYWGDNGAYTVAIGSLPNTASWIAGDNRSQQLVMYMIDMTLFHLHARISPRNIPEIRTSRYESAIMWLNKVAKGHVTANLPKIQPPQGKRFRGGSQIKQNNIY